MIKSATKIALVCLVLTSCFGPKDIRNDFIKNDVFLRDSQKATELLEKMEMAHGGRENWDKFNYGKFVQVADWYGKLKQSHWDTIPQKFEMKCELKSNNSVLTLLNGSKKGAQFKIENNVFFEQNKTT